MAVEFYSQWHSISNEDVWRLETGQFPHIIIWHLLNVEETGQMPYIAIKACLSMTYLISQFLVDTHGVVLKEDI